MCLQEELEALRKQGLEQELVYSYVACMTVRARDRRKGVASALLRAAEIQAISCSPGRSRHTGCKLKHIGEMGFVLN